MRIVVFFLFALLVVAMIGCADRSLNLTCQYQVPTEFREDPPGWIPPNGQPERVRYITSYEAFWWNCVMLKADDLENRCPCTCSGTPAASYGCSDGAADAENQINRLLEKYSAKQVQDYLQSIAVNKEAKEKIAPYFPQAHNRNVFSKGMQLFPFWNKLPKEFTIASSDYNPGKRSELGVQRETWLIQP